MAGDEPQSPDLPPLLLLRKPIAFLLSSLSTRFHLLKPWESPLPLPAFLSAHATTVQALLITGLAPVTAVILDSLPSLGCIVTTSVGVDHIDLLECARRGVAVANAGSVFSDDAADYAVGLLIDVLRRISAADGYLRQGLWTLAGDFPLGSKLSGKRIGIIGLGSIGSRVAKRLEAFSCTISYNSLTMKPSVPYKFYPNVCDLASNNDALIVCCALTSKTHHIINKEVLSALGKQGIIINIGRGALVDEEELIKCLMNGDIKGAGLDVFKNEPLVPKELFSMKNVVLSSHSAVNTEENILDLYQLIIANFEAFFSGTPLISPVSA
ncbi:Hydroxypyruvate reductase protein [Dioscorea alata]|uniref:Hydroxypyruvate reductase protein n=2 Tax=Dioscorea alata TaxID=55571 RepID=A0ACB7V4N1_DIOAL|nr:Hydroxypyruvate reductase protein [Dioscorea alata]KAH7668534.1 Hydroxypyruvate reductase protein [Dioscorea alata]